MKRRGLVPATFALLISIQPVRVAASTPNEQLVKDIRLAKLQSRPWLGDPRPFDPRLFPPRYAPLAPLINS